MIQLNASRNSGFSLIEMAIVLAIIGLILGGIMLGQDLLRASQLQKVQSDIQQYDAAVQQFYQKYNSLPGDMPDATTYWSAASNGNGDYLLNAATEWVGVWQQMALAGMITGSYTGASTNPVVAGTNVPKAAIDGVAFVARQYGATPALTGEVSGGNILEVGGIATYYALVNFLTASEAQSLDAKMDDGYAARGRLRGSGDGTACPVWTATSGDYGLNSTATGCIINYHLDRFK